MEAKFLTADDVAKRYDVDRSTIYRWKKEGRFPKAVMFSGGTTRWRLKDLEEWENTLETGFMTKLDLDKN